MAETLAAPAVKYEHDRAVVRLVGPVTVETILALCDEVDLATEYYQYPVVELQLASPGGDVAALDHFLSRLAQWRTTPAVIVETLALTQAASAAAIMLSLGDIGRRGAYASAQLVYHDSRTMLPDKTVATRAVLDQCSKSLADTDSRMLDILVSHVWEGCLAKRRDTVELSFPDDPQLEFAHGVALRTQDDLRKVYSELNARDRIITPVTAKALFLVDTILS